MFKRLQHHRLGQSDPRYAIHGRNELDLENALVLNHVLESDAPRLTIPRSESDSTRAVRIHAGQR